MPAPKKPQDHKKSAKQILEEAQPFDWKVGTTTLTIPPAGQIPGGGRLVLQAADGELSDGALVRELFARVGDEVEGLEDALDRCTMAELSDLIENWLEVGQSGE